jgi:uncharacterized protein (TIGR02996 family)
VTEEQALLRSVLEAPFDDAPRLVYADWLQERDRVVEVPCPVCTTYLNDEGNPWKGEPGYHPEPDAASGRHEGGWTNCKRCNCGGPNYFKAGRVRSPNRFGARADFIRVQCELARLPACRHQLEGAYSDCKTCILRERERAFLRYENCKSWLPDKFTVGNGYTGPFGTNTKSAVFCRGFVGQVMCSLATFMGGECGRCEGRGNVCLTCRTSVGHGSTQCPDCKGKKVAPGLAAALFASHPITDVRLTDRRPYWNGKGHAWYDAARDRPNISVPRSAQLPTPLYEALGRAKERWVASETEEAAIALLGRACVDWGRSVAKGHTHRIACRHCSGEGCATHGHGDTPKRCWGKGYLEEPGLPPLAWDKL